MAGSIHPLHVGIIGGGIGGMTCAIALARGGAQVTVLEAAAQFGEIGAGIQTTPNVARFLVKTGVDEIIGQNLIQCEKVQMRFRTGELIAMSDLQKIVKDYGFPWWVVRRDHLYFGLLEGAKRAGVEVVPGSRVQSITHDTQPVEITTETGNIHRFDFVIGADGLKSTVRTILFPEVKPRAATYNAAYRAVIPYKTVFEQVPEAKEVFRNNIDIWLADNSYCITYPMTAGTELNLVLSHHTDYPVETVEEADMDELKTKFAHYEPMVQKVIALIPQSSRWPLLMVGPLQSWSSPKKNVVLMGDAAHAMVNHMAQGAATSMEDGIFLGRVISEVIRGSIALEEAVEIYEKTRMPRAWTKQQASFNAGALYMCSDADNLLRTRASSIELRGRHNVTHYRTPGPTYRSWNLWGYADSIPGVYAYDAEGDADNAVCQYLGEKSKEAGRYDEKNAQAERLRDKWWSWKRIEARGDSKAKL